MAVAILDEGLAVPPVLQLLLQRVGQVHDPLQEARPVRLARRRHELRLGMPLAEIEQDRGGLVHHQIVVQEGRHAGVGIELEIVGAPLLAGLGIHEDKLVVAADLVQHGMRRHVGAAGAPIEGVHGQVPSSGGGA